jgi:O-antigen/teichoic acid export membrane protein
VQANDRPRDRSIARASLGAIGTSLALQATLVVSGVLGARILGVSDRGYLAFLILVPAVLFQLGGLGLPVAVTFEVARRRDSARAIAGVIARPALVQAFVLALLHAGLLYALFRNDPQRVQVAGVLTLTAIPCSLFQQYGLVLLLGMHRFSAFNALRLLPPMLYAALVAGLFITHRGSLISLTIAWVLAGGISMIMTVGIAFRGLPREGTAASASLRSMFAFGLKGLLGSSSPLETFRIDQVVVGLFLSPASLGLYVVAMSLANLPGFIGQGLGMVAYPQVASRTNPHEARQVAWRFVVIAVAISALIVGSIEIVVSRLLPLAFGQEFAGSIPVARVLLISALLLCVRRVFADVARGTGHPGFGTLGECAAWLALAPALIILAPRWGINGVAASLAVSSAVSLGVLVLAFHKARPVSAKSMAAISPGVVG